MMFDAGTFVRVNCKKHLKVLVEVKSSTEEACRRQVILDALEREDCNACVSFIVVDNSFNVARRKAFRLEGIQTLNRGKRVGTSFAKGESLQNARLQKVDIDKHGQVFLTALDGKSTSKTANRLIFLISLADINNQVLHLS